MSNKPLEQESEDEEPQIKPLTVAQVQDLLQRKPSRVSIWHIVGVQVVVAVVVALLSGLLVGRFGAWSALWGGFCVVLPSAVFARGVTRRNTGGASGAVVRLFGWEVVKLVLCVALLAASLRVVSNLNWLALLAGMVVTMKAYWFVLVWDCSCRSSQKTD